MIWLCAKSAAKLHLFKKMQHLYEGVFSLNYDYLTRFCSFPMPITHGEVVFFLTLHCVRHAAFAVCCIKVIRHAWQVVVEINLNAMNIRVYESTIVAIAIVVLGLCIKGGIDNFANKDRKVTVKGLAEREVEADKVTWPILSKETGNDLPQLYELIAQKQAKIKRFLLAAGIKESEISVDASKVIDMNADQYATGLKPYRYNITSIITVTSNNVKLVRNIIARQGELLKQGVAIVEGGYESPTVYEYVSFKDMKPKMMEEAIANAEKTAQQFADNSHSTLNKIVSADQGQFSIDNRDLHTPWIKKVRVVTTITYSLKD